MVKKIISFLLLISLIITSIFLTFILELRWNLQEQRIVSYLKKTDLTFILKTNDGEETDLLKNVKDYLALINIPEETIEKVLNSDATKEFAGRYLKGILNSLIFQKEETNITSSDLKKLVDKNMPIVEETLKNKGKVLSDEEKTKIYNYADKYSTEILDFFPVANKIITKLFDENVMVTKDLSLENLTLIIRKLINPYVTIITIIITLILIIVLWLINKNKRCYYFKKLFFIYAFILIIVEILLGTIIKEKLMIELTSAASFINFLINEFSKNLWILIIITLLFSFVLSKMEKRGKDNEKLLENIYKDGRETTEKNTDNE